MASPELIKRILQRYDQTATHISAVQTGYRSEIYPVQLDDSTDATVILYKREPGIIRRIKNANHIGNMLSELGFSARRTLDDRIVTLRGASSTTYAALYNYLPGTTIPWEAYTMNRIKQLGAVMSTMHSALAGLDQQNLPNVHDEYYEICVRMERYFTQPEIQRAILDKLKLLPPHIDHFFPLLTDLGAKNTHHQQPLHMDFVRGNILFTENSSQISGILDFEKTAWGHPLFDIARTLAFLLVDCKYKPEEKIRKYFLDSGYQKRGTATLTDEHYLEPLLDLFLTYDFYKFLRHNPYESLHENEHFMRTRNLLITRGVLRESKKDMPNENMVQ
jgi:Ser/Thr protein kinase RdoA (MazF antagonist)